MLKTAKIHLFPSQFPLFPTIHFILFSYKFIQILDTFIAIDDGIQNLRNDDRILISLTVPNICSWEPDVESDNKSDSENQISLLSVLIEDDEVIIEKWLINEILKSILKNDDHRMQWYLMK